MNVPAASPASRAERASEEPLNAVGVAQLRHRWRIAVPHLVRDYLCQLVSIEFRNIVVLRSGLDDASNDYVRNERRGHRATA